MSDYLHTDLSGMDSQDLANQVRLAEAAANDAIADLIGVTTVHKFDQNDKSTWPEEGLLFLMLTRDAIGIETKIIMEYSDKTLTQYQDRYWSYSAPALQTKLKSLSEKHDH